MRKTLIFLFIFVLIVGAILYFHLLPIINSPYKGYKGELFLEIKRGSSVKKIVELLEDKGVIRAKDYFLIYYKIFHSKVNIKSGEYLFNRPLNYKEVLDKLNKGKVYLRKITIKEGLTIKELAQLMEKHNFDKFKFLKLCKDSSLIKDLDEKADDLEGYLYPQTYMIAKGTTEKQFIKLMVDRFRKEINKDYIWRAQELNMSLRKVITLASLIEEETSLRSERFLISSVFHNRLKRGISLGCDPTIIYALSRDGLYKGKLGWDELKYDSPYNTRLYKGLPPGPICSPGKASIEAALYPEESDYLFFVAKDNKSHYFSKTLKEHNRAVKKYIINKEREK